MRSITPVPTRPNRATRRCHVHRNGRTFHHIHAGTTSHVDPVEHTVYGGGTCRMGHPLFPCGTCNGGRGPGQCQGDVTCHNGTRCAGGCTVL